MATVKLTLDSALIDQLMNRSSLYTRRLIEQLVDDARKYGLVLVVGAGINGATVPKWKELVERLLDRAIDRATLDEERIAPNKRRLSNWCQTTFDSVACASIAKALLGAERYRLEIQDAIYENVKDLDVLTAFCQNVSSETIGPQSDQNPFTTLRQIGFLCQTRQTKAVATFNFDTLLEAAIQACAEISPRAKYPRSYFRDSLPSNGYQHAEHAAIPVYHVHGLLPHPSTVFKSGTPIVMSYGEYFDRYADPLSWETSSLLHLIRHYCTLWIGTSLTDWNMLRLLDGAGGRLGDIRAYSIQALRAERPGRYSNQHDPYDPYDCLTMRFRAELFRSVGVKLIAAETFQQIPEIITQITAKLKR